MTDPGRELTPTEAGLLGLLAIPNWPRPWTSYELAKQAGRSLAWFWPRVERQFIRLPRRLVELGFAESHDHPTGRRAGTRYTITEAGRAALADWLRRPGGSISFEGENIMRVFLADSADIAALRAAISGIAAGARADRARLAGIVAHPDVAAVSQRDAVNALSIRLVADLHETVQRWAQWALAETSTWTDPRDPWPAAATIFAQVCATPDPPPAETPAARG